MTVTDHAPRWGMEGEGRERAGTRARGAGGVRGAKAEGDVADLLGVSAHESSVLPAATAPDEGAANDLLDVIAQDHLQRAAGPGTSTAQTAAGAGSDGGGGAALLQKEIEALLSGEPRAEGPVEKPSESAPEPVRAPRGATREVSDAELAVLLPAEHWGGESAGEALAAPLRVGGERTGKAEAIEAPSAAAEVARELAADNRLSGGGGREPMAHFEGDEEGSAIAAAEGVLAEELAALQREAAPAVDAVESGRSEAGEPPEAAAGLTAQSNMDGVMEAPAGRTQTAEGEIGRAEAGMARQAPVPVVILQPDEVEEERESVAARMRRSAGEAALMAAQLVDLPFAWISGLDKHILGVAAVVFFLSGWLLVAMAWWMARGR